MHRHFPISKKKKKKGKQVQLKPDQQNPNLQELGCLSFPTCTSFPPAFRTTCVLRHFQPLRGSAAIFDHRHQNPATTKVEALLRSPETQVAIQLPLHSLCCFLFFFAFGIPVSCQRVAFYSLILHSTFLEDRICRQDVNQVSFYVSRVIRWRKYSQAA